MSASDPEAARALLDGVRGAVDAALEAWLPGEDTAPGRLHEAMRYSVLSPGKRFRPALMIIAADLLSVPRAASLPGACALEMIHAFSLIHDDLPAMDDDDLRRGRPTNHRAFGEAVAILAGDALESLAFEIIARETPDPSVVPELIRLLARAVGTEGMIGGQVLDLLGESRAPDRALVEEIHRRKTAALIRAACEMAGALAAAPPAVRDALSRYGEAVGLAFQVTDDLLDVTSTPEILGKGTGKDEVRGKQTFPACVGLEASREYARALIDEALAAAREAVPEPEPLEILARFLLSRMH